MGVQIWTGFQQMQSYYKSYDIPRVTPEDVKEKEALQNAQQSIEGSASETAVSKTEPEESIKEPDMRSKNADLENISLTFHKEDTYDYIGSQSGLVTLDMQQAISDMKKDSVLQEYQYFVGSSQNFMSSADGTVILK